MLLITSIELQFRQLLKGTKFCFTVGQKSPNHWICLMLLIVSATAAWLFKSWSVWLPKKPCSFKPIQTWFFYIVYYTVATKIQSFFHSFSLFISDTNICLSVSSWNIFDLLKQSMLAKKKNLPPLMKWYPVYTSSQLLQSFALCYGLLIRTAFLTFNNTRGLSGSRFFAFYPVKKETYIGHLHFCN